MKRDAVLSQLINDFQALITKMIWLEKRPRDFGTGDLLSPSEIHNLDTIGRQPGINVTQLAGHLGVTKGAVSQMLRKLEKKGLAQRSQYPDNQKEMILHLTAKGQQAFAGHRLFHAKFLNQLQNDIFQMPAEHVRLLGSTLKRLNQHLDKDIP